MRPKPSAPELTCREAGRLGGLETLARYGREHYQEIGSKGQAALAFRHDCRERSSWGRLGGRPRKPCYPGAGAKPGEGREGEPARAPAPSSISQEVWVSIGDPS